MYIDYCLSQLLHSKVFLCKVGATQCKVYFTLKNSLTNEKGFRDGLSDSTPQKSKEMPIPSVGPILSLIPIYIFNSLGPIVPISVMRLYIS